MLLKDRELGSESVPYSDTWSEGALEGLAWPVPPLEILGNSWPTGRRFEQASQFHRQSVAVGIVFATW